MNWYIRIIYILIVSNCCTKSYGNILTNMGSGFGYCASTFTYSAHTSNNYSRPILFAIQPITSIQGAQFFSPNDPTYALIQPYTDTRDTQFTNLNLCHGAIYLCNDWPISGSIPADPKSLVSSGGSVPPILAKYAFYTKQVDVEETTSTYTPPTYYFNAFTALDAPTGEWMGPSMYGGPYTTTQDFNGVFFNNTNQNIQLTFSKNQNSYTVTLDSGSFSTLSSDSTDSASIRSAPNAQFIFKPLSGNTLTIPIQTEGIGQINTSTGPTPTTTVSALTYTYEIYENSQGIQVGTQGFNIGNYNQIGVTQMATSDTTIEQLAPLRDLNAIPCAFWYQSPTQAPAQTDPTQIMYALPEQVWVMYASHDQTFYKQVLSGKAIDLSILRPRPSEGPQPLLVFSIATTITNAAQQFLDYVSSHKNDLLSTTIDAITNNKQVTAPATITVTALKTTQGEITDPQGTRGTLILVDMIAPTGAGASPRYYTLYPAILQANDNFSTIITSLLNSTVVPQTSPSSTPSAVITYFQNNIVRWLQEFAQNYPNAIAPFKFSEAYTNLNTLLSIAPTSLITYLHQNGSATLFKGTTSQEFSETGAQALYNLLFGPLSLLNPPVIRQAGQNSYLYPGTMPPTGWPT